MKKREKLLPKIVAFVALFAIIIGIIGTGVLIIFESFFAQKQSQTLTQEELEEYLKTLSGSTLSGSTLSGTTVPSSSPVTPTGTGS